MTQLESQKLAIHGGAPAKQSQDPPDVPLGGHRRLQ